MNDTPVRLILKQLPSLATIFGLLNSGKHLNRHEDTALWVELEEQLDQYQGLFSALEYDLQLDGRGFAWFDTSDATSSVSKSSRRLALLFMVLFEYQADQGQHLGKFHAWVIDTALLRSVWEKNQALLEAEGFMEPDSLQEVISTAVRYGFMAADKSNWRLLPAVYRYLDHFETIAEQHRNRLANDINISNGALEA